MTEMKSMDIESPVESPSGKKPRNPYASGSNGAGVGGSLAKSATSNTVRSYLTFCLALWMLYSLGKMMMPADKSQDEYADAGAAEGGWGTKHHHPVKSQRSPSTLSQQSSSWNMNTPVSHPSSNNTPASSPAFTPFSDALSIFDNKSKNGSTAAAQLDILESDLLMILSPLVFIPKHNRPEYKIYQTTEDESISSSDSPEEVLYDKNTAHGMAFDYLLHRDTRPFNHDNDQQVIQRFVLTLLFYATGGKQDEGALVTTGPGGVAAAGSNSRANSSGWDADMAHFLTGLHECHWVKKSLEDQFWGILSLDSDTDRRVGVTKCNADMEVTEIRLADLSLVGFIPGEIKWLSSLESLDIQNNHLAGPIPKSLGELDELRYLSLDGNNFSGTIPDIFEQMVHLERAYLNFNDFAGAMPSSLCTLREEGVLTDLWSDCGGFPITCTCCTVCCDMVAECDEMDSQKGG